MQRLFISYARTDEAFARKLAVALSGAGADVWIDIDDIPAGMKWSSAIQEGLDSADSMLVILSPESMQSDNVEDEWQYFMDQGKPIIPIHWQPANVHFQLHRLQYVDFHQRDFDTAFAELRDELKRQGVPLENKRDELSTSDAASAASPQQPPVTASRPIAPPDSQTASDDAPKSKRKRRDQESTSSLPMMPLIGGGATLAVIAVLVMAYMMFDIGGSPSTDNTPMTAADFEAATSIPAVQYNPGQTFSVHTDASGNSETFDMQSARISLRVDADSYDDGTYWYRLRDSANDETGWQIPEFLPGIDPMLLSVVPYSYNRFTKNPELTLYRLPDGDSPQATVAANDEVWVYGYAIGDDGAWWYLIETTDAAGMLYRGWTLLDSSVRQHVRVAAGETTAETTFELFNDSSQMTQQQYQQQQAPAQSLPPETRLRAVGVTGEAKEGAMMDAVAYVEGRWVRVLVPAGKTTFNESTLASLRQ